MNNRQTATTITALSVFFDLVLDDIHDGADHLEELNDIVDALESLGAPVEALRDQIELAQVWS